MHYQIAVIDDSEIDTDYVTSLVKRWAEKCDLLVQIKQFLSAEAFLFTYDEDKSWDVLLLDIEMGGKNGVELAKIVRQSNDHVQLVFITGFPDFIAEGYEVSALHYLMKPVSEDKLEAVLDRAIANLAKAEKRLCVIFDRETEYLPLSQISYIEAQKQYVVIHTDSETYRMKTSLVDTEKQLDEYFFKCQRSYIVNLRYIKRIKQDGVILKNGEEIPISRGMADKIGKEMIRLF